MATHCRFCNLALAIAWCLVCSGRATAYLNNGHWDFTATDGATPPIGNPVTLTWSIVPDGTTISHLNRPSELVSVFDSIFPGSTGVEMEEKPWFSLVEQCFDRWSAVSGVTFEYESLDDGLSNHPHGATTGELGLRGDVRLAGAVITSPGTLAETGFIPNADITFDTSETVYFGAVGGTFPYINLRTTLMHEIGHSLGLGHSISNNAAFLMEGFSQTSFDGPQFDDIRGVHFLYGDINEKSNAGAGNDSIDSATPLGLLLDGQSRTIGHDAATGTFVGANETDFVSISNSNDLDFYSFTIDRPSLLDIELFPAGPTYNERVTVTSFSMSDLSLEVYASDGKTPILLAASNSHPIGEAESILGLALDTPGTYFARISGSTAAVQFYELAIHVDSQILYGDFNNDGVVDAADYTVWRDHVGEPDDTSIHGHGDGVPGIDAEDYVIWKSHYGDSFGLDLSAAAGVPEPSTILCLAACFLLVGGSRRIPHRTYPRAPSDPSQDCGPVY